MLDFAFFSRYYNTVNIILLLNGIINYDVDYEIYHKVDHETDHKVNGITWRN